MLDASPADFADIVVISTKIVLAMLTNYDNI